MSADAVNNEVQRLFDFLGGQAPPPGAASATSVGGASSQGMLSPNGSGGFVCCRFIGLQCLRVHKSWIGC
jgi:hypothetical protein